MIYNDTYRTLSEPSEEIFKDKGSKFIAKAFPISSEEDIKYYLDNIRKTYHNAHHYCYAFKLGFDKHIYKINDDGEPAGSAGKPIYGQIQSFDLTNTLIVVIRYFGGIKLGIGGLMYAYKNSTKNVLEKAKIITKTINEIYEIRFPYSKMNEIMKSLKDYNIKIFDNKFDMNCSLKFSIRKKNATKIYEKLTKHTDIEVNFLEKV